MAEDFDGTYPLRSDTISAQGFLWEKYTPNIFVFMQEITNFHNWWDF